MSVGYVSVRIAGALWTRARRAAQRRMWFDLLLALALALPGVAVLSRYLLK